jgi:hypothetical protein
MKNRGSHGIRLLTQLFAGLAIGLFISLSGWGINAFAAIKPQPPNSIYSQQGHISEIEPNDNCLLCHVGEYLEGQFEDGTKIQLSIDRMEFVHSIHSQSGIECGGCHAAIDADGHQQEALTAYPNCYQIEAGVVSISCGSLLVDIPYPNLRAMSIELSAVCSTCHEEENTIAADNVHLRMLEQGNLFAPICVDCHGSHDTRSFGEDRSQIAMVCSKCHPAVYSSYRSSVHGEALDLDSNPDVPTCIDCHGVHNIQGPRDNSFRNDSVYICEGCHGNEELMEKYGISVEVFQTYLTDIHGNSQSLFGLTGDEDTLSKPVCFDCHGIHNIRKTDDPRSAVSEENIQTTCKQCHDDDVSQAPSIWLSHYPPSLDNNPGWAVVYWVVRIIVPTGLVGYLLFIIWNEGARWFAKRRDNKESGTTSSLSK